MWHRRFVRSHAKREVFSYAAWMFTIGLNEPEEESVSSIVVDRRSSIVDRRSSSSSSSLPHLIVVHGGPGFSHEYLLTLRQPACLGCSVIFYDQYNIDDQTNRPSVTCHWDAAPQKIASLVIWSMVLCYRRIAGAGEVLAHWTISFRCSFLGDPRCTTPCPGRKCHTRPTVPYSVWTFVRYATLGISALGSRW